MRLSGVQILRELLFMLKLFLLMHKLLERNHQSNSEELKQTNLLEKEIASSLSKIKF